MTLLKNSNEIREELQVIRPIRIAVAYIGKEWKDYIDLSALAEVIISPTIGSNPDAIEQLLDEKGYENVHFLTNLHSKIYISTNFAIIGSPNLSKNALSETGLHEVAYKITDPEIISELEILFNDYKLLAQIQFPDEDSKNKKLIDLKALWTKNKTVVSPVPTEEESDYQYESFLKFTIERNSQVFISWANKDEDLEVNEESINGQRISAGEENISDVTEKHWDISIHPDDYAPLGHWILIWTCTQRNKVSKGKDSAPYWLYVHRVYQDCTDDEPYTSVLRQYELLPTPKEPFPVDGKVFREAFSELMDSGEYPMLNPNKDEEEKLLYSNSADEVNNFLIALRDKIQDN